MSLMYSLDEEMCAEPGSASSFATQFGFSTAEMAQMTLVAYISTIFNVFVLWFHWTTPPHPKFLLRAPRKISIRMHVLAGTVEITTWAVSWFWGFDDYMEYREVLTKIQVIASFVHAGTAAYQTPIVFGTQAVMVPAYVGCVGIKTWCAVDLLLNLSCARKSVRLYNVLSIYTWCRIFIGLFGNTQMFQDSLYSVSILFAGAVCLPSVGPGAFAVAFLGIAAYQLCVYTFGSPEFRAHQFTEHGRDLFDSGTFDTMLAAAHECPFSQVDSLSHQQKMRALFDLLDADKSGTVDREEFQNMAKYGHSASWLDALEVSGKEALTFEDFCRVLGSRSSMSNGGAQHSGVSVSVSQAVSPSATYDTQARFLFEKMNNCVGEEEDDNPDALSVHDLAFVLVQYGVPAGEAKQAMRKFDSSGDGELSFDEFKVGFKPLVLFQIAELKGRLHEKRQNDARVKLEKQASLKAIQKVDADDHLKNRLDAKLDALEDHAGKLGRSVGKSMRNLTSTGGASESSDEEGDKDLENASLEAGTEAIVPKEDEASPAAEEQTIGVGA